MKTQRILLTMLLTVPMVVGGQENAQTDRVEILLQSAGTVFKGLPAYVAVEVRNFGNDQVEFPECGPVPPMDGTPFMLRVEDDTRTTYSSSQRDILGGFVASMHGGSDGTRLEFRPTWKLVQGASMRVVVNIAPHLNKLAVQGLAWTAGLYKVQLGIVRSPKQFKDCRAISEPMELRVSEFPSEALGALRNKPRFTISGSVDLDARGRNNPRFAAPTPKECAALEPKELRETVALSALFHHIREAEDISTVPLDEYRPCIGDWLSPELDQIEYEMLLAKGEKGKALAVREVLLKRAPSMKHWADGAERGEGFCHMIREGK